jgi:transposase
MLDAVESQMQAESWNLDHIGLVGALCQDIGLIKIIDDVVPNQSTKRKLTLGQRLGALVINGLGFAERRLYLTADFLENKPVHDLFGTKNIKASDFNEHSLGRALDEISEYGVSQFFTAVSMRILTEQKLISKNIHLDSTSFSVEGEYQEDTLELKPSINQDGGTNPHVMNVTYGYSKDSKPHNKQWILNLMTMGAHSMPIFCAPHSGNASDKKTFLSSQQMASHLLKQWNKDLDFIWVADSAFYTLGNLQALQNALWITRVPESIKQARFLTRQSFEENCWKKIDQNYSYQEFNSNYADISQRWLLVFSKSAWEREVKTFEKRLNKQEQELNNKLKSLKKQKHNCQKDLEKDLHEIKRHHSYFNIHSDIKALEGYKNSGRPKDGSYKETLGYTFEYQCTRNEVSISAALAAKGRFILATNELDSHNLSSEEILKSYKEQQSCERGFRFLKDPLFLADHIFLKSPKRIEALAVVMCLTLLVYAIGEHRLKTKMQEDKLQLPNQKKKLQSKITLRWAFEMMRGICLVHIKEAPNKSIRHFITRLNESRIQIIKIFGPTALQIYQISTPT